MGGRKQKLGVLNTPRIALERAFGIMIAVIEFDIRFLSNYTLSSEAVFHRVKICEEIRTVICDTCTSNDSIAF